MPSSPLRRRGGAFRVELLPLLAATEPLGAATLGRGLDGASGGRRQTGARLCAAESRGQGADGVTTAAADADDVEAFIFPREWTSELSFFHFSSIHRLPFRLLVSRARSRPLARSLSFFLSERASERERELLLFPRTLFRREKLRVPRAKKRRLFSLFAFRRGKETETRRCSTRSINTPPPASRRPLPCLLAPGP